jgi:excisionase family DNA binding protein
MSPTRSTSAVVPQTPKAKEKRCTITGAVASVRGNTRLCNPGLTMRKERIGRETTQTETPQTQLTLAPRGLSISDAAAYIGVTAFFVERMIRCGRLPALRMCRQYTVLVSDLDAFLDTQPKVNPAVFAAPPDDRRRWRKGKRQKAVAA